MLVVEGMIATNKVLVILYSLGRRSKPKLIVGARRGWYELTDLLHHGIEARNWNDIVGEIAVRRERVMNCASAVRGEPLREIASQHRLARRNYECAWSCSCGARSLIRKKEERPVVPIEDLR